MVRFAAAAIVLAAILPTGAAHGAELLLLDFWSPSCGPCMQMKPTIQNFKNASYPIREVDTTREPDLAAQFDVQRIPCFVMTVDGREVDRQVGFTSGQRLQEMFGHAKELVEARGRAQSTVAADDGAQTGRTRHQSPDSLAPIQAVPQATPQAIGPAALRDAGPQSAYTLNQVASGPPRPSDPMGDAQMKLLAATVRLRVDDAQGHAYGTGTIIDARDGQALVVTCGHLFRETKGEGPLSVEVFDVGPDGLRVAGTVKAQLISYDLERDIALVGIWPDGPVVVAPVAPKGAVVERGDRAVSVGCSNGKDPTALPTRITSLDRYQGPPNIEASGAPVEGRSGGGLFNAEGQLIGVCFAADYEGKEGLYSALESIHDELADKGLSEIYQQANSDDELAAATGPSPASPIVRGQEPLATVAPVPTGEPAQLAEQTLVVDPARSDASLPSGLNTVEQAAWEEIMTRASKAEVICIIRPQEPGGQSEVITLNDVSPDFIRALEARQRDSHDTKTR